MQVLLYVRLVGYTAGTLLQLFWMVVILGYRRQRNFERVFFFMCLALFFFYGASLLALNAQIYYTQPPASLELFSAAVISVGLLFFPALLLHLHVEYADTRGLIKSRLRKRIELFLAYALALFLGIWVVRTFLTPYGFDFVLPLRSLGVAVVIWLTLAAMRSGNWQIRLARHAEERSEVIFHWFLGAVLIAGGAAICYLHLFLRNAAPLWQESAGTILSLLPILPLGVLIYYVLRYNFLQFGRQKNLLYAVVATFLALFYLSLVRRVGVWLEPMLPPEASASILLFVLVIFIEPLQRVLGRRLQETARRAMDQVQQLTAEIQKEARQGDLEKLAHFIESKVQKAFELSDVKVSLREPPQIEERHRRVAREAGMGEPVLGEPKCALVVVTGHVPQGHLVAGNLIGVLKVRPHGAALSGETRAALELLCQQLPGALELCRLIEKKLQLERELAERERLALLGQMAASISHNLKNPLGSMKTILQVQLESPELPDSLRGETRLVIEEIDRLSAKLNQLLRFSRPAVRAGSAPASDASAVAEAVAGVLRHEAEWRGMNLETTLPAKKARVAASDEAVNEILSNLVVNSLEAGNRGGRVALCLETKENSAIFTVEDDGAGISAAAREKILQPFFTTKAQGTGLGLAIVARRVAEFGGRLEWESPAKDGRGARFRVSLPLAEEAR